MIGTFSGMADWYEFTTAPDQKQGDPSSLGSAIINYKQNTRLTLMEQTGPFVRGSEYYEDSTAPDGWKFVANLYGIITHEPSEQAGKEGTAYLPTFIACVSASGSTRTRASSAPLWRP